MVIKESNLGYSIPYQITIDTVENEGQRFYGGKLIKYYFEINTIFFNLFVHDI